MSKEEMEQLARKIKQYCTGRHCVDGCYFVYYKKGDFTPHCKLRNADDTGPYPEDWKI